MNDFLLFFLKFYLSEKCSNLLMVKLLNEFKNDIAFLIHNFNEIKNKFNLKFNLVNDLDAKNYYLQCKKKGIFLLCPFDENYPKKLLSLSDYPIILHCLGNLKLLNQFAIAIIGSRNASLQGLSFAKNFTKNLVSSGYLTISGFAKGIDSVVHENSLNSTIAVLGQSIEHFYPLENSNLYNDILKNNSLIISEYNLNTTFKPYNYSYRNRIIAALSTGVVIIEAAMNSGTLVTAKYALDQGKDIFAVPGHPYDIRMKGSNYLIKNGAILIESANDVINYYSNNLETFNLFEENIKDDSSNLIDLNFEKKDDCSEFIYSKLSYNSVSLFEICELLNLNFNQVQLAIGKLELEGKINNDFGMISKKKL